MYAPYPRPLVRTPNRRLLLALMLVVLLTTLLSQRPLSLPIVAPAPAPTPAAPVAARDFGRLQLPFVPNVGQIDPAAPFEVSGIGGTFFFTPGGVVMALPVAGEGRKTKDEGSALIDKMPLASSTPRSASVLRIRFDDANPAPAIVGAERLPGVVNYIRGNVPAQWHTNVPTYAGIVYKDLYNGIHLRYDSHEGALKGTYTVAPNADPMRIRWRYDGAQDVRVDADTSDLVITLSSTNSTSLREKAPLAWQDVNSQRIPVSVRYDVAADGSIGFVLGSYAHAQPLTIDPTLVYSTYLGGIGADQGNAISVDNDGSVYVTGFTQSTDFPHSTSMLSGTQDVFVAKLSADGHTLIYSTYLGGSGIEDGKGIALDKQGNAYITGWTRSADFPLINPLQVLNRDQDAFVTELDSVGRLIYSTYIGGDSTDGADAIVVDSVGNSIITGYTLSANFPTNNALQPIHGERVCQSAVYPCYDAFVTKLNTSGNAFIYSTYLGGSDYDEATSIAVDTADNAYITGFTYSPNFRTSPNAWQTAYKRGECFGDGNVPCGDAFVTKLNAEGTSLVYSTYLGGASADYAHGIAVDVAGNAYVTGNTFSADFPTTRALQPTHGSIPYNGNNDDAFVTKLNPDGRDLLYSSFLGGSGGEGGSGIAVDNSGHVYVTGSTNSRDFPVVNALQANSSNSCSPESYPPYPSICHDVFVTKVDTTASTLDYSTYLSGSSNDLGDAIVVDSRGNAYVTGTTGSTRFPITNPTDDVSNTLSDVFITNIGPSSHLHLAKTVSAPTARSGDALTYTVTVSTTEGAAMASLSDALPVGLTYVAGSASGGATYDAATRQLHFNGTVTPGADVTISYRATVDAGVSAGSVLINTASVTGTGYLLQRSAAVAVQQPAFNGTLVLIYTSGDNNLSKEMVDLINNAEKSADNPNIVTILVLDGPGTGDTYIYHLQKDNDDGCPNYINPTCDGRYVEGRDFWHWGANVANLNTLDESAKEEDVASPYALAEFLKGEERAYPNARQIVLSMVGHGGGWSPEVLAGQPSGHPPQPSDDPLGGLLWDDHPGDTLSTPALGKALRLSKDATGRGIDLLYLDACLMGMAEVAYEVRDSVHYLLASESWKWAEFPYDAHLKSITATTDARAIGEAWLRNEQSALPASYPFTMSLTDLQAAEPVRAATDQLAAALTGVLTTGRDRILAAFGDTDCFDSNEDYEITPSDNYCDLASFARGISERFGDDATVASAAQAVKQAVAASVIFEQHHDGVPVPPPGERLDRDPQLWHWDAPSGISIYLPLHEDSWKRRYYYRYLAFTEASQWDEFLDAWWNNAVPPPDPTCPPNCSLPPGPPPVAPFALHANSGYNNIQLDWDVALTGVSSFRVSRAISGTTTFAQVATTQDTFYHDTALERGKTYCYRVDGLRTDGSEMAQSNIDCATFGFVDLWVPDVWGQPGTTALVPINIRNADGLRIAASDIWLDYDPKVISPIGVQATALTEGNYTFQAGTETPGRVKIAAISTNSPVLYDGGTLFWVQVKVAGNLGDTSPLDLREYISGVGGSTIFAPDDLSHPVPLELHDGTLRVGTAFVLGDVSGDGVISAIDAFIVEQIATHQYTPTAEQHTAGDVNGDGEIAAADATMILYYAANNHWPSTLGSSATDKTSYQLTSTTPITVSLDDTSGAPGTLAQTTLRVSDLVDWSGGDFVIAYDPAIIGSIANVSATGLANGFSVAFHDNHAGLLRISMASATPINGSGALATIMLRIAPGAQVGASTTLALADARLSDGAGRDFVTSALQRTITRNDGQMRVVPMQIFLPIVMK